jgi:hypothetical protein
VVKVFPRISEQGQDYLEKIAQALFLLQNPAVPSFAGDEEDRKGPAGTAGPLKTDRPSKDKTICCRRGKNEK